MCRFFSFKKIVRAFLSKLITSSASYDTTQNLFKIILIFEIFHIIVNFILWQDQKYNAKMSNEIFFLFFLNDSKN